LSDLNLLAPRRSRMRSARLDAASGFQTAEFVDVLGEVPEPAISPSEREPSRTGLAAARGAGRLWSSCCSLCAAYWDAALAGDGFQLSSSSRWRVLRNSGIMVLNSRRGGLEVVERTCRVLFSRCPQNLLTRVGFFGSRSTLPLPLGRCAATAAMCFSRVVLAGAPCATRRMLSSEWPERF